MIVHRLVKTGYVGLDGEGARLYGGRWNSPGRPMIYTAASPSLALLEILVHFDLPPELIPSDYQLLAIEAPDDIAQERLEQTPTDAEACVRAGDDFLQRGMALSLSVASVVVPQERNLLINPRHADARRLRVLTAEPFTFDPRLLG